MIRKTVRIDNSPTIQYSVGLLVGAVILAFTHKVTPGVVVFAFIAMMVTDWWMIKRKDMNRDRADQQLREGSSDRD